MSLLAKEIVIPNLDLNKLNSWHVGGAAEVAILPQSLLDLKLIFQQYPEKKYTWLGLGSNVLIPDEGIAGVVILTKNLKDMEYLGDGNFFVASGVSCAKFARFCIEHNCIDAAFFAGIPGTMGGALRMNAGAFGGQTWEHVFRVQVVAHSGNDLMRIPDEYSIGYRSVVGKNFDINQEGFYGGFFHFKIKPEINGKEYMRNLLKKRNITQPVGTFNCGSVFKNPEGDYAARLIEASDLKGYKVGKVGISDLHANFILNYGDATSSDIKNLIHFTQATVQDRFGIALNLEVKFLGDNDV